MSNILYETKSNLDCKNKEYFKIGRDQDCDIRLSHPTVSATHAILQIMRSVDGRLNLFIKDNRSKLGIYIEGHRVPSTFILPAARVQISVYRLAFEITDFEIAVTITQTSEQYLIESKDISFTIGNAKLLDHINIVIEPAEFIGIYGPSGSGKTTFIKMLNGYRMPEDGFVAVGGMPLIKYFNLIKNFIAYVPQEDILHSNLSVRESLQYAGKLRFPNDVNEIQRDQYINATLENLELNEIRNQKVSSLSGGQRKRVSIGMEILAKPKILLADEPDAGLDPHVKIQLMQTLRKQAETGCAVVMTTHTLESFFLFDHVMIISKGKLCFFGPPGEAIEYFNDNEETNFTPVQIFDKLGGIGHEENGDGKAIPNSLAARYIASEPYNKYITQRRISKDYPPGNNNPGFLRMMCSWLFAFFVDALLVNIRQFVALTHRYLNIKLRSFKSITLYLLIPLIILLVLSAQKVKNTEEIDAIREGQKSLIAMIKEPVLKGQNAVATGIIVQIPATGETIRSGEPKLTRDQRIMLLTPKFPHVIPLTLVLASIFCGIFISCSEISHERAIYTREHKLTVNIGSYLSSKILFLFGVTFIQMSLLMLGTVLIFGISSIPFAQGIAILTLSAWAGVALGLFLSSIDKTGHSAMLLSIIVIIPQIIFSGAIGPAFFSKMNTYAKMISSIFISRWGFEGMLRVFNHQSIVEWGPEITKYQIGFPDMIIFGYDMLPVYLILAAFIVAGLLLTSLSLKLQEKLE